MALDRTQDDIRDRFVEKAGLIAQGGDMPRTAGRVFGLLIWEGEPVAFGALAERLGVSRGSVSASVRLLEERGVVRRTAKPGDRGDWFELMPDPFASLLDVAATGTARAGGAIEDTLAELPPGAADVRRRVEAYATFYRTLQSALADAARTLRARR